MVVYNVIIVVISRGRLSSAAIALTLGNRSILVRLPISLSALPVVIIYLNCGGLQPIPKTAPLMVVIIYHSKLLLRRCFIEED